MTATKEFFIHLISSYINEEQPNEPSAEVDWNEILRLAGIHSVQVMTYLAVEKLSQKPPIYNELKNMFMASVNISTRQEHEMKKVIKALNENQIAHTLFKGYLLRDLYPDKEARTFGDIDLLIEEKDREKSHEVMQNMGYTFDKEHYDEEVWAYNKGVVCLEVHTSLSYQDMSADFDYKSYFKKKAENIVLIKDCTYQLTAEDHFLYILTHLAKHFYHMGVGIRMVADVAVFAKKLGNKLNWDYISKELETLKLKAFTENILSLCKEYFFVNAPIKPLHQADAEIMEYILNHGVFGSDDKNVSDVAFHRDDQRVTLFSRIFISYEEMKKFEWFKDCPMWLLPYGWIRRALWHITNKNNTSKLGEKITSLGESGASAKRHQTMLNKVGLR